MLAQNLKATRSLARAWWSENGEFRVKAGLKQEKFTIYHEMYCMTESYLRYVFYCKTIIIFSCGYSNLYFLLSKIYLCENAFCTPVLSKWCRSICRCICKSICRSIYTPVLSKWCRSIPHRVTFLGLQACSLEWYIIILLFLCLIFQKGYTRWQHVLRSTTPSSTAQKCQPKGRGNPGKGVSGHKQGRKGRRRVFLPL